MSMSEQSTACPDPVVFVETLKEWLCELSGEISHALPVLKSRGVTWPEIGTDIISEEAVALATTGRPALTPRRRREARSVMSNWVIARHQMEIRPSADKLLADENHRAYDEAMCADGRAGVVSLTPEKRKTTPQQRRLVAVEKFCSSQEGVAHFRHELAHARHMDEALALTRKQLPGFTPSQIAAFLTAIGYPIAQPRPQSITFLRRVGLLKGEASEEQPLAYREVIERLAHDHELPLPAIEYLVAAYAGAWRVEDLGLRCQSASPPCAKCELREMCTYAQTARSSSPKSRKPVREWVESERPRERLLAGRDLSDAELLAIILRTGTSELSAVELARRILELTDGNLYELCRLSPPALQEKLNTAKIKGVGPAKIAEIRAALELGIRAASAETDARLKRGQSLQRSRDVFERYRSLYVGASQEEFRILILDTKYRVVRDAVVSRGTLDASIVHPRDVFRLALDQAASAVIFVHNHPSGDPTPSKEDRALTRRLAEAGQLLGIRVLDHVIIGAQSYFSFADEGELR
jgi:DNA repair protein RadC